MLLGKPLERNTIFILDVVIHLFGWEKAIATMEINKCGGISTGKYNIVWRQRIRCLLFEVNDHAQPDTDNMPVH